MAATGWLVWTTLPNWWLLIPAMVLHGFTIVTMFAPMHECVHRTVFATRGFNEALGWLAGLLGFYNFTYYRYYHTWHHRYTQDPVRDPELMTPKPRSLWDYLWEISTISFWLMRPLTFCGMALGRTQKYAFVPESARTKIALSLSPASIRRCVAGSATSNILGGPPSPNSMAGSEADCGACSANAKAAAVEAEA